MRNVKKIIALIATVTMIVAAIAMVPAVAAFPDVVGTPAYEAVSTLQALGIVTGDYVGGVRMFRPESEISRAEFAALVVRATGLAGLAAQSSTAFADVPANHWASGYVRMAADRGFILGHGDGTFTPDANVTFEQAVTMVVRAIGWQAYARTAGGFPTGYLVAGNNSGITNDVGFVTMGQPAQRQTVARLLYAALDTPMMQRVMWQAGDAGQYMIMDGSSAMQPRRTLLTEIHRVSKLRAQVVATPVTSLDAPIQIRGASLLQDTIQVRVLSGFDAIPATVGGLQVGAHRGNHRPSFRISDTLDVTDLIGRQVVLYVREQTGHADDLVISVVAEGRNRETSFAIADFDGLATAVSPGSGNRTIRHRAANATAPTTHQLAPDFAIIYNGRAVSGRAWDQVFRNAVGGWLTEIAVGGNTYTNGRITLLDPDGSGIYSVVFVTAPTVFVVEEVDLATRTISERAGNIGNINLGLENVMYSLTRDGEAIRINDLNRNDVLMVERNNLSAVGDDGFWIIRVVTNTVEGSISARGTDSRSADGFSWTIGGNVYRVADGAFNMSRLALGARGTFFIDEFGNIAAFEPDRETGPGTYVFVFAAQQNSVMGSTGGRGMLQVMGNDGVVRILSLANWVTAVTPATSSSVTFPGAGGPSDNDWGPFSDIEDFVGQMMRIEQNAAGEIATIELATPWAQSGSVDEQTDFLRMAQGAFRFDRRNERFARHTGTYGRGNVNVGPDTLLYFIGMESGDFDPENSDVRRVGSLADSVIYQNVTVFGSDFYGNARVVLVVGQPRTVVTGTLAVFDGQTTVRNADGATVANISFWENGQLRNIQTTQRATPAFNNVVRGTLFSYDLNAAGYMDAVEVYAAIDFENFGRPASTVANRIPVLSPTTVFSLDTDSDVAMWEYVGPDGNWTGTTKTLTFGPIASRSGNRIVVGPRTAPDADIWNGLTDAFNIPTDANIYVLEWRANAAALRAGVVADITNPPTMFMNRDEVTTNVDQGSLTFPSPVLQARDWVVIQEYNYRITDVVVIKAPVYRWI